MSEISARFTKLDGYLGCPGITEEVVEITTTTVVRAELADALSLAARKRGRTPAWIMAEIIEIVLTDGLIDALLDDGQ